MGRRGPPKKPGSRHNATATTTAHASAPATGHDSLILHSPPGPPARLGDDAAEAWRRFAGLATQLGRLTAADLPALELLCETWAEYLTAAAIADDPERCYCHGESGGIYCHPAVFRKQAAGKSLKDLFARFGLTPMDRVTLGVVVASGPRKQGLADFSAARSTPPIKGRAPAPAAKTQRRPVKRTSKGRKS